jgi:hypothetical protein
MERDTPHDCMNSDTSSNTRDDTMAQEDLAPSQTDVEIHVASPVTSPKRSKKMKTDRDTLYARDRTRSRT